MLYLEIHTHVCNNNEQRDNELVEAQGKVYAKNWRERQKGREKSN